MECSVHTAKNTEILPEISQNTVKCHEISTPEY